MEKISKSCDHIVKLILQKETEIMYIFRCCSVGNYIILWISMSWRIRSRYHDNKLRYRSDYKFIKNLKKYWSPKNYPLLCFEVTLVAHFISVSDRRMFLCYLHNINHVKPSTYQNNLSCAETYNHKAFKPVQTNFYRPMNIRCYSR